MTRDRSIVAEQQRWRPLLFRTSRNELELRPRTQESSLSFSLSPAVQKNLYPQNLNRHPPHFLVRACVNEWSSRTHINPRKIISSQLGSEGSIWHRKIENRDDEARLLCQDKPGIVSLPHSSLPREVDETLCQQDWSIRPCQACSCRMLAVPSSCRLPTREILSYLLDLLALLGIFSWFWIDRFFFALHWSSPVSPILMQWPCLPAAVVVSICLSLVEMGFSDCLLDFLLVLLEHFF